MNQSDCKRFLKLLGTDEIGAADLEFMQTHRLACPDCSREEDASVSSLFSLRESNLEPEMSERYVPRTMRKADADRLRSSFGYWMPALLGACVASLILLAAIQVAYKSAELPVFRPTTEDARLIRHQDPRHQPLLLLNRVPVDTDTDVDQR